jgi:hypothetical protein
VPDAGGATPFRVRAATRDITPRDPAPLCGFAWRTGSFASVHDALEIGGVRLAHPSGDLVLVSFDLAYASPELVETVRSACAEHGAPGVGVLVAASHTHFAPSVVERFPRLGAFVPEYARFVASQARSLVEELFAAPGVEARLHHGAGRAAHAVHRRRRDLVLCGARPARRWVMAPDESAPRDETVHAIALAAPGAPPAAILWSYACHPVGLPFADRVSADFPGAVRSALRARFGAGVPVVFLQGFSGDVRPCVLASPASLRERISRAVNGPQFGRFDGASFAAWCGGVADAALRAADAALASRPLDPAPRHATETLTFARLVDGRGPLGSVGFARMDLASDLALFAVAGEAMTEHAALVRGLAPGRTLVPVGCADAAVGYVPTSAMVRQGGYEGGECLPYFGVEGRFRDDASDAFRSVAERLVRAG